MKPRPTDRRSLIIATLLSLLLPGLGHAYALRLARALVWFAGTIVVGIVLGQGEENTGLAIGIHTHGGCSTTAGNSGTAVEHAVLQSYLASPRGVCIPTAPACYPDCNLDGALNLADFGCFQTAFALGCP